MVLVRVCPWCRRTEPWRRGCRCLPDPAGEPVLRRITGLDLTLAVHGYDEVVRRFVLAAKNGGREDLLRRFGVQIAAVLAAEADRIPECRSGRRPTVVWVPASADRRRRRGYDQGRLLARTVGRELGLSVQPLLTRAGGEAQEGRDRAERLSGPRLRCRVRRAPTSVIVVDDVITTGASVGAAAAALRGSGAEVVIAAAVASSGSDGASHPPVGNAGLRQVSRLW
jgi:predicted amidophosphoribosyltransferase